MGLLDWVHTAVTIICSVFASSGVWTILLRKSERKDGKTKMLIGLGHDRIMTLCSKYISRGYITKDEYEDLITYLWSPYESLGGNGSAKRMLEEVQKLPIHGLKED